MKRLRTAALVCAMLSSRRSGPLCWILRLSMLSSVALGCITRTFFGLKAGLC